MNVERKVTMKDPAISGQMPNAGGSKVGYHSPPRRKSRTETMRKIGMPSRNRKATIRPRIRIETQAKRKKMRLMMISFSLRVMGSPSIRMMKKNKEESPAASHPCNGSIRIYGYPDVNMGSSFTTRDDFPRKNESQDN
jgi:hypothetical protein